MQFIRLNNQTTHYALAKPERNHASDATIVFINSLGTDMRIWDDVKTTLAGEYLLLTYDKRGHGLSDTGATPYTIDQLADDLIALLTALNLDRVILCGLSVGGLIAQAVFAKKPELVEALILSNTAHKIGTADMWRTRIDAIRQNGLSSVLAPTMERWFTPTFRTDDNAAFATYCNMFTRQPVDGYTATCEALAHADYTAEAQLISVPTLCIAGDQDGATPPTLVQEMADLIPAAEFIMLDQCGHIPCVQQPQVFADTISKFIKNI
ncbi:3-oxoadipate enol-lactonase [Paenochrobactrum sp. BZR 588]|uniref:3-oxoadipate enol-lactonase n=1 Tax=Paenochrobactrum TaxID=999488 RepID=UPI0035BC384D